MKTHGLLVLPCWKSWMRRWRRSGGVSRLNSKMVHVDAPTFGLALTSSTSSCCTREREVKTTTLHCRSRWRSVAMSSSSAWYLVHASGLTFHLESSSTSPRRSVAGVPLVCMRRKAAHAAARAGSVLPSMSPPDATALAE